MSTAILLPDSTPHWSKGFTPQTTPEATVRCSYNAINWPRMKGVSFGAKMTVDGRFPSSFFSGVKSSFSG